MTDQITQDARLYLTLTQPHEIDQKFLSMFLNSEGKNRYFRRSGKEFTREELIKFCEDGLAHGDVFYYAIRARDDDQIIGAVRIGPIDFANSVSDMVTLVGDVKARGKGLGTEAIQLGNKVAFERHHIRKLHGGLVEHNIGSLKAYTRAGWHETGRLKDHCLIDGQLADWIIISIFNPNWQPES